MADQNSLFPEAFNESAVLSAFVKSVRLRRPQDAAIWLHVLWNAGNRARTRAQRRILLSAAEDNLNIAVMRSVSGWFNSPARFDFNSAVREAMRIMKTPNWFATDRGRTYMRRWRQAELAENPFSAESEEVLFQALEGAVRNRTLIRAMHAFNALYEKKDWNHLALAQLLIRLGVETDNAPALALAELFEANLRHLWTDTNYSGQALYVLMAGPLGDEHEDVIIDFDPVKLAAKTTHFQSLTLTVPDWAKDGVRCSGKDARFSGVLQHMARACDAYEYFGRLDPDTNDDWSKIPVNPQTTESRG